jgi:hypothetical protein
LAASRISARVRGSGSGRGDGEVLRRALVPALAAATLVLAPAGSGGRSGTALRVAAVDYATTTSTGHAIVAGTNLLAGSQDDDALVPLSFPFPVSFYGLRGDLPRGLADYQRPLRSDRRQRDP